MPFTYTKRETQFEFTLGRGEVVTGWDQGISGMCVGEVRKLVLPSDIAYGDAGALPDILPGATLVFEVELMDILSPTVNNDDDDDYYDESNEEMLRHQKEIMERHREEEQHHSGKSDDL